MAWPLMTARAAGRITSEGLSQMPSGHLAPEPPSFVALLIRQGMAHWSTIRRVVTLFLLLLAATEVFACDAIASPACLFSSHTTQDSDGGCAGDGCLCCCAHIVVVPPIIPLAPLGFVAQAAALDNCQAPDVPPTRIEHPPRS
jgi:hypothetical protein